MALKRIFDLEQSINPRYNPRANFAFIGEKLSAPFSDFTGVVHDGGLHPLHKLTKSTDSDIKTIDDSGNLIHSPNNYTFSTTNKGSGGYPGAASDCAYGESIYVQTSSYPATEGIYYLSGTWQLVAGSNIGYNNTVAYGNGIFVSVNATNGDIATSPDGINWSFAVANITAYAPVSFLGNYFICIVGNKIYYSIDGSSWQFVDLGRAYNDVVYDGTKFLFINSSGYIAETTDLITYTQTLHTELNGGAVISYGNGFYIILTATNSIITYDFVTFNSYVLPFYCISSNKTFEYNSGIFYAISGIYSYATWYSNDGIIWIASSFGQASSITISGGKLLILSGDVLELNSQAVTINNGTISVYSNDVLMSNEITNMGLSKSVSTKYYDDIYVGDTVLYGVKRQGGIIYIDRLNNSFVKSAQDESISVSVGQAIKFMRFASDTDNTYIFYYDGAKTVFSPKISGTRTYSTTSITDIFDNVYVLNTGATPYYLGCQERISNADGNAIAKVVSYSHNTGTGAITTIDTKNGWFYSYNNAGTIGIVGIELIAGTYYWKNYTVGSTGVFTQVDTVTFSTSVVKGINGQYSEYETFKTNKITALGDYKAYTGGSGTGADGVNFIGYFSIINRLLLDDATNYVYLRAVYNRALKSCDTLSFSIANKYIGRIIEYSNVDFKYRPQFTLFGTQWILVYRDLDGEIICLTFDYIQNCETQFTKISNNLYLLNTIDAYNLIDCNNKTMLPSGLDYNGAVLYSTTKYSVFIVNDYYKTPYNTETGIVPYASNFITTSYDQRLVFNTLLYNFYVTNGSALPSNKFNSEFYINEDALAPVPIYAKVQNSFIYWNGEVYQLLMRSMINIDLTMQIGTIFSSADFFYLYGNYYLYDGSVIWLLDVANGDAQKVAIAEGLVFITFSQEAAFFFSLSTNDLYSFSGGRLVEQIMEMHEYFTVDPSKPITGDYLASDNLLVLSKDSKVALIYSGKISRYDDTGGVAFARAGGVYYKKSTGIDAIAIHPLTGSYSAISYLWKSAFFKTPGMMSNVAEVNVYIYSATKAAGTLTAYFYSFDETMTATVQTVTRAIVAGDYDADGYFLGKFTPNPAHVYGFAVGVLVPFSAQVISVDAAVEPGNPCTVSAANTMQ